MELSFITLSIIAVSFAYVWDIVKRTALTKLSSTKFVSLRRRQQPTTTTNITEEEEAKTNYNNTDQPTQTLTLDSVKNLRHDHEAANVLWNLIEQDGAGEWPPRVVYEDWPSAIQPYKEIYLELAPMLSCADPMIGDDLIIARREKYRAAMRERLSARIDTVEVEDLLNAAEAGNWSRISRDQLNGVYCAVAVLRHAYR